MKGKVYSPGHPCFASTYIWLDALQSICLLSPCPRVDCPSSSKVWSPKRMSAFTTWRLLNSYESSKSTIRKQQQRGSIASYASADIAALLQYSCRRVGPSVRQSVRLSVTFWYCIKMNKATVMISSPEIEPEDPSFADIGLIQKFELWRYMRLGQVRIGNFRPLSCCISEMV